MSRDPAVRSRETGPRLYLRPMRREDVAAVTDIEIEAFTTPWSGPTFRALLGRKEVLTRVLATPAGEVVGYAVLWYVLDEAELANIAVRSDFRGLGHGERLLRGVLDEARSQGIRQVHLEVREGNRRARDLYRRAGFRETGRRTGYYRSPREDALVLALRLD